MPSGGFNPEIKIDVNPIGDVFVSARELTPIDHDSGTTEIQTIGIFAQSSPLRGPVQAEMISGLTTIKSVEY